MILFTILKKWTGSPSNIRSNQKKIDAITENHKPQIVDLEDAPEFLVDNKYLLTGYRKNFRNYPVILKSLMMRHNETLNIWTHLIGALIIGVLLWIVISDHLPHSSIRYHITEVKMQKRGLLDELDTFRQSIAACSHKTLNETESLDSSICGFLSSIQNEEEGLQSFARHHSFLAKVLSSEKKGESKHHLQIPIIEKIFKIVDSLY